MIRSCSAALLVIVLASCATPRAIIVEKAPEAKTKKPSEVQVPSLVLPGEPDDGIRLPDDKLLAMPGDGDFRATALPLPTGSGGPGTVTVRPPTDPPPRPKPKPQEDP